MTTPDPTPRTAAGRALLDNPGKVLGSTRTAPQSGHLRDAILAIEAEAAPSEGLRALADRLTVVIDDAESQHPGGWGPDITMVVIIREVRDALLACAAALAAAYQQEPQA